MKLAFPLLETRLGAPAHTFRYIGLERPVIADHVWRCGCGARDRAGMCDLIPCAQHAFLDPVAYEQASDVRSAARMA